MSGLTKSDERSLRAALARLDKVNRPAYLGGIERYNVDQAIKAIDSRLNPKSVDELISMADRVAAPLEHLMDNIDRQAAIECLG